MDNIFRLLVENLMFPIWIKDKNLRYIFVNKSYAELNDKTIDEIVGYRNDDIFEPATCEIFTACSRAAIESGKIIEGEMYTNKGYKYGTILPLKDKNEEVMAICGIFTDIDKIKETEAEIKFQRQLTNQIMDILPGMVFCKDNNGKYIYANKEYTELYETMGINNIIGKTDIEINADIEKAKEVMEEDKEIIDTKEVITKEIVANEVIWYNNDNVKEVVKMPLLDSEGKVKGVIGRALDITENKKIQQRLEYLSYTDILTGIKNRTYFEEQEAEFCKEENLPLGLIMGDVNGLKILNDTFGHREGDNLLKAVAKVLKNACEGKGEVFRIGGDEFVILLPNSSLKDCETIIKKIDEECRLHKNDLFNVSISLGAGIKDSLDKDIFDVIKEAEAKVYRKKLLQEKSIKSSILNLLKVGLGVRSVETDQHTDRVILSAVKVGEKLGLERSVIDELTIAAELHDIGKIGISESILLKPSALNDEEYEVMKTHSEKGYRIVMAASELKNVAESVLYHHERWDGRGYPMGLKGNKIPLLARIINICDSYDVMINERIYKTAMAKEDAIEELKRCSGTQFDPDLVDIFIELLD